MYGIDSSRIFVLLSLVIGTEEEIAGLDSDLGGERIPSLPSLGSPSLFLGNSRDFAGVVPKTLARGAAWRGARLRGMLQAPFIIAVAE
jgi:hypothetical protein